MRPPYRKCNGSKVEKMSKIKERKLKGNEKIYSR